MVLLVKIAILQCMFALLISINSAEATSNTQILSDDKLIVERFSFSIGADLDGDTDFSFFKQTQLDITKHLATYVPLFAPPKAFGHLHSIPPIRAPPNFYS